jgi:hypothetical protein
MIYAVAFFLDDVHLTPLVFHDLIWPIHATLVAGYVPYLLTWLEVGYGRIL